MHTKYIFSKYFIVFFALHSANVMASNDSVALVASNDSVAGGGASNGQKSLFQMLEKFETLDRERIEQSCFEQTALLQQSSKEYKKLRDQLNVAQAVHLREFNDTRMHFEHSVDQLTSELHTAESTAAQARAELAEQRDQNQALVAANRSAENHLVRIRELEQEQSAAALRIQNLSQELEQRERAAVLSMQQLSLELEQVRQELHQARVSATNLQQHPVELNQVRQELHTAGANPGNSQNNPGTTLAAATLGGAVLGAGVSLGIKRGCLHQ